MAALTGLPPALFCPVVAAGTRGDGRIRVVSTFNQVPVEVALDDLDALFPARRDEIVEWARYPLGVAWALRAAARDAGVDASASLTGIDLAFSSDVPVGAGLSSSAAIEGATAAALNDIWGLGLDRVALAQAGRRAENEAVGAPTGIMDQMAALLGESDAGIVLDCRSLEADVVELGFAPAALELLVMDTRVTHAHSTGGYGERRAACERGAAIMGVPALRDLSVDDLPRAQELMDDVTFRRVRHVVTEDQRVLDAVRTLRAEGPRAIGSLLDASHASMRDDFEITLPAIDALVAELQDAIGPHGGVRMTGGGFGGAVVALVEADAVETVVARVEARYRTPEGSKPLVMVERAHAGASFL